MPDRPSRVECNESSPANVLAGFPQKFHACPVAMADSQVQSRQAIVSLLIDQDARSGQQRFDTHWIAVFCRYVQGCPAINLLIDPDAWRGQ